MRPAEKLLIIASLVRTLYGQWKVRHLLPGLVMIMALFVMTTIMASATVVGGLWAAYHFLSIYALTPGYAVLLTGATALLIILILIQVTRSRIHALFHKMPQPTNPIDDAMDAFMDGLLAK